MSGKVIEMPKSNQQLWDDLFNGFKNQIDRAIAKHQASGLSTKFSSGTECEGGAGHAAIKAPCETSSAGFRQSQEVMNLDDLGIGFGKREEIL